MEMKKIQKLLRNKKYICFLDFEGTQFSHEMIAYGAVLASLDKNGQIKKSKKPIKCLVKSKNKIGRFVEELTGISQQKLDKVGIQFSKAMTDLKKYCGMAFSRTCFMTFGNHDMKILAQSIAYNLDSPKNITSVIQKNYVDFQAVISEYIKDDHNNPYSLANYLKVFKLSFDGVEHDPQYDALNLMHLYDAFLNKKEIVLEEYLKVLSNLNHLPAPAREALKRLSSGQDVSSSEFVKFAKDYLND